MLISSFFQLKSFESSAFFLWWMISLHLWKTCTENSLWFCTDYKADHKQGRYSRSRGTENWSCQNHKGTFLSVQLLEAETMRHIFMNNYHLCNEISERVVQHFVHRIETHGRHVEYLRFLQTIVKADGKYVKKCQDMVMTEVCSWFASRQLLTNNVPKQVLSVNSEREKTPNSIGLENNQIMMI